MKHKSTSRRGTAFLKAHALLFALFIVGMTLNILVTVNHPTNAKLSLEVFRMMITQSLIISLSWAVLFLTHLGLHQIRTMREGRQQQAHFDEVEAIQERYSAVQEHPEATEWIDLEDVRSVDEITEADLWRQAEEESHSNKTR